MPTYRIMREPELGQVCQVGDDYHGLDEALDVLFSVSADARIGSPAWDKTGRVVGYGGRLMNDDSWESWTVERIVDLTPDAEA